MSNYTGNLGVTTSGGVSTEQKEILDLISLDTGTLIIASNLQVDGSQTTINSTNTVVDDPVLVIGADQSNVVGGVSIEHDGSYSGLLRTTGDVFVLTKNSTNPFDITPLNSLTVSDLTTSTHTSINAIISANGSIDTHSDVNLGTSANNDFLTYDLASSKWINTSVPSAYSGLRFAGYWDAGGFGAPATSPTVGDVYIVNSPGSETLNGYTDWKLNDFAVKGPVNWYKIDNSPTVVPTSYLYSDIKRTVGSTTHLLSDEVKTGFIQTPGFDETVSQSVVKNLAGTVQTLGSVGDTVVIGEILYTQTSNIFSSIDFSDVDNPVLLNTIDYGTGAIMNKIKQYSSFVLAYQSAFSGGVGLGIKIIDVSSPGDVSVLASICTDINVLDFVGSGRFLYVSSSSADNGTGNIQLTTFEFLGTSVTQLSTLTVSSGNSTRTDSMVISGSNLFILTAESPSKVIVVSISNASTPTLTRNFSLSAQASDMTEQSGVLYFTGTGYLASINVLDPAIQGTEINTVTESKTAPQRSCTQIEVFGDYLFLVEDGYDTTPQSNGLYMYNAKTMEQIQRFQTNVRARVFFIMGSRLGIVNFDGKVYLQKLNSQGFDFINSQGITAGKLAVKTDLTCSTLNVASNTAIGGGLFVNGDSLFTSDLVMTDGFMRGCIEAKCIDAETGSNLVISRDGGVSVALNSGNITLTAAQTNIVGLVECSSNLVVLGSLTVQGSQTILHVEELDVEDSLANLGSGNPADLLNLGILFESTESSSSASQWAGLIRKPSTQDFYLIRSATVKPSNSIDPSSFLKANLYSQNLHCSNVYGETFRGPSGTSTLTMATEAKFTGNLEITGDLQVGTVNQDSKKDAFSCVSHKIPSNVSVNLTNDNELVAVSGCIATSHNMVTNIVTGTEISFIIPFDGMYELSYSINADVTTDSTFTTVGFIANGLQSGDLWTQSSTYGRRMTSTAMETGYQNFTLIRGLDSGDVIKPRIAVTGGLGLDMRNYSFMIRRLRTNN
jgi:hypothetical protein